MTKHTGKINLEMFTVIFAYSNSMWMKNYHWLLNFMLKIRETNGKKVLKQNSKFENTKIFY